MRTLVVSHVTPWPLSYGTTHRVAATVRALSELGSVDLVLPFTPADDGTRDGLGVARIAGSAPPPPAGPARTAWRWLGRGLPYELAASDDRAVAGRIADFVDGPYDLTWVVRPHTFVAAREVLSSPVVVDLDDLMGDMLRRRLQPPIHPIWKTVGSSASGPGRNQLRALRDRLDVRLWDRLYREVSRSATAVLTCSGSDRDRLGLANAMVLQNTWLGSPVRPAYRASDGAPVILLQGMMRYLPNRDAVRVLIDDVAPHVWRDVPEAQFRIVGSPSEDVKRRHDPPRVVVTGFVDRLDVELYQADVVAVPLRFGSGSRIKLIEAFANRIPVVSTSFGAEGLGCTPGVQLAIEDDPRKFAAACVRAIRDRSWAEGLTAAAALHFRRHLSPSAFTSRVAEIVDAVAPGSRQR